MATIGVSYDKLVGAIPQSVVNELIANAPKFYLTSNLRLAHFLAQCSHESGNFRVYKENLYYSADSLTKVFPKYFPTLELAKQYEKKPQAIANKVYASRMGNGNEASGDGYKYSGKGAIQTTGKQNYALFSQFIGEDCVTNPDLLITKYPISSALYFFYKNNLWAICDEGAGESVVKKVTRRVNGGQLGIADRIAKFNKFHQLLIY